MKRLAAVTVLLVLLGGIVFLALRPAAPAPLAPVTVMALPYRIPPEKGSLFDVMIPRRPSWGWVWRLKETVLGRPKTCDLGATVVKFEGSGESFLASHPLPPPAFADAKGLKIWLLRPHEIDALSSALRHQSPAEILYMPRITTSDRMQASLSSGAAYAINGVLTPVGLTMDFLSRVRRSTNDVTTVISLTEIVTNQPGASAGSAGAEAVAVQTDFEVAARLQIPNGSGAFLLQEPPAGKTSKRIGVLLSVNTSKPK
jgi:hypothetical protein